MDELYDSLVEACMELEQWILNNPFNNDPNRIIDFIAADNVPYAHNETDIAMSDIVYDKIKGNLWQYWKNEREDILKENVK